MFIDSTSKLDHIQQAMGVLSWDEKGLFGTKSYMTSSEGVV
jgi:hypothetical protein